MRDKLNAALEEAIYTETNWANHLNAAGCPCYTLANHDGGTEHVWERRRPFRNEQTVCFRINMGHEAMTRGNSGRLKKDVEEYAGGDRPFVKVCKAELEKLDNEWEIKRDE